MVIFNWNPKMKFQPVYQNCNIFLLKQRAMFFAALFNIFEAKITVKAVLAWVTPLICGFLKKEIVAEVKRRLIHPIQQGLRGNSLWK
jgi:hypothetical protein